jgi:hypothetical protein
VRTRALDEVLPRHDWNEVHAIELAATPEAAVAALLATPVAPGPLVRALFRLRGLRADRTIEEAMAGMGFVVLRRTRDEIVLGAAGRPWTRGGRIRALADARDGDVRLAVVRAIESRRSLCSRPRRGQATDAASRRGLGATGASWAFSALVRRRGCTARERAERVDIYGVSAGRKAVAPLSR